VPVTDSPQQTRSTLYREQLRTPWWWYLAGLFVAALLGAEFAFAIPSWWSWSIAAVITVASLVVVWRMSSGRVEVTSSDIYAGDQSVSLTDVRFAVTLSRDELRRLVGRHGDPLAFNFIRGWIGPGVQLVLDERRREPYWVVSSRHPDRLGHVLAACSIPVR
jgi:Protein of unknown function (DUF3093)